MQSGCSAASDPTVVSLERLLHHDDRDMTQAMFEAAVLGELLKEMLDTRYGQVIMKGLAIVKVGQV